MPVPAYDATVLLSLLLLACGPATIDGGPDDTATPSVSDGGGEHVGGDGGGSGDGGDEGPVGDPALVCQASLQCGSPILDEPKVPCELRLESGDGAVLHDGWAMIEKRGRSSLDFPKPQYAIELHDEVELLVWFANPWSYLDSGVAPTGDWTAADYDDSSWSVGTAPLGYGADEATTVSYGGDDGDKHPTTWFRRTFQADADDVSELRLGLMRDDGAAVYLNGTEVARSNLAADAGPTTLAASVVQEDFETQWYTFDVDPDLLVAGENTLAVEVHQADAGSSDLNFDLYLQASSGRHRPDLFGFGSEDDWVLNGAYIDRLLWRNKFAYDLFQSFGGSERYAAEQAFCELSLDGDYVGVYLLGERIEPAGGRLEMQDDDGTGSSFVIKLDDAGGFRDSEVSDGEWRVVYPDDDEAAWPGIAAALDTWEAEVLAGREAQWDYFDVDSAVDWVLIEELTKNNDAYFLSVHLWRDGGGKMFLAPWDFDLTFGYPYYDCGAESWVPRQYYVDAWADSPLFQERLAARWVELRKGPLAEAALLDRIAGYEAIMGDAIDRNFARWPIEDIAFSWGDVDNWLCPVDSWEEEHTRVLDWLPERLVWIDDHVAGF